LHSSRHPRDLHSFPTRRSSDLALGQADDALNIWKQVTENHSYPRAKVQLAELYVARNQFEPAKREVDEVLADDAHAPSFQRRRRSEEHTSELQSRSDLVCRLLL